MNFEISFPSGYNQLNIQDGNIDVNIRLESGEIYAGTLFTLNNIAVLMRSAEHSNYFWASDMAIIDNLEMNTITECISKIIIDDMLDIVFKRIK